MVVLRKILVAVDGSEASVKAADFALTIAKNNEAETIFLHVIESAKAARGLEEVGVLGSVSRAVSEKSTVPVTIVPL